MLFGVKIDEVMGWEGFEWLTRQWTKVLWDEVVAEVDHAREINNTKTMGNNDSCVIILWGERVPIFGYVNVRVLV